MSGIITTFVINVLEGQVDDCGVVVWYDPGGYFRDIPPQIDLADTTIALYQGENRAMDSAATRDITRGHDVGPTTTCRWMRWSSRPTTSTASSSW